MSRLRTNDVSPKCCQSSKVVQGGEPTQLTGFSNCRGFRGSLYAGKVSADSSNRAINFLIAGRFGRPRKWMRASAFRQTPSALSNCHKKIQNGMQRSSWRAALSNWRANKRRARIVRLEANGEAAPWRRA